jgi:hypothetical protein
MAQRTIEPRKPDIGRRRAVGASQTPLAKFLEAVFLWLPKEQSPGFGAVCLALLRQAVLSPILMLGPFVAYRLTSGDSSLKSLLPGTMTTGKAVILLAYSCACFALVQELCRYAFIRRAANPAGSALLFGAVVTVCSVIVYHDSPYTLAWMTAAQVGASVAMLCTRIYPNRRTFIVAAIVVCQTAAAVAMPQWGPHHPAPAVAVRLQAR